MESIERDICNLIPECQSPLLVRLALNFAEASPGTANEGVVKFQRIKQRLGMRCFKGEKTGTRKGKPQTFFQQIFFDDLLTAYLASNKNELTVHTQIPILPDARAVDPREEVMFTRVF